jgi:predicted Holliday junction resolvase-like endonuclease
MKNLLIVILLIIVFILAKTVIRLENYHYAHQVGMCDKEKFYGNELQKEQKSRDCFELVQTRTNSLWHLFYAIKNN